MAERLQSNGKLPPSEQVLGRETLGQLTLGNIYGEFVTGRDAIHTDLPYRNYTPEECRQICKQYNIPTMSSYSNGGSNGELVIYPGKTKQLSWWAPHQAERTLLIQLAHAVAKDKQRPFVLDAACGTGFVGNVLADTSAVKVMGIEVDASEVQRALPIGNDLQLRTADVWDIYEEFGPQYPPEIKEQRNEKFKRLQYRNASGRAWNSPREFNRHFYLAKQSLKDLQGLVTGFEGDTPVDMVICSFMHPSSELTVPLRDGIYPRALVYVRGLEGVNTGYDNGRENVHETVIFKNRLLSFDPGTHYETVAQWRTFSKPEWDQDVSQAVLPVEVLIQLRRDVMPTQPPKVPVPQYNYDTELIDTLRQRGKYDLFSQEIERATAQVRKLF